jgi:hypothetical protein
VTALIRIQDGLIVHRDEIHEARRTGPFQMYVLYGPHRTMIVIDGEERVWPLWHTLTDASEPKP